MANNNLLNLQRYYPSAHVQFAVISKRTLLKKICFIQTIDPISFQMTGQYKTNKFWAVSTISYII